MQTRQEMAYEGVRPDEVTLYKEVDIRYRGQAYELTVPLTENFAGAFHQLHEQTYGYYDAEQDLEVVNVRLKVVGSVPSPSLPEMAVGEADPSEALYGERPVVLRSNERDGAVSLERVRFYLGEKLRPGHVISGPAVIMLDDTTIFVAGGDEAIVDSYLNVIIELP